MSSAGAPTGRRTSAFRGRPAPGAAFAFLLGCAPAPELVTTDLEASALDQLTLSRGCGDVILQALDETTSLAVTFILPGAVRTTYAAELDQTEIAIPLSDPGGWSLEVWEGTALHALACEGLIEPDLPLDTDTQALIDHTWVATSGWAILQVQTTGAATETSLPATATLGLLDAQFTDGVRTLEVPAWTTSSTVGQFPEDEEEP